MRTLPLTLAALGLACSSGAVAVAGPPAAAGTTLTRSTTISWTGAKGVRLTVPDDASLPPYGARLFLRGGSYAFVRIAFTRRCDDGVRCIKGRVDYTRGMSQFRRGPYGPGTDHWHSIPADRLLRGAFELYLFTDGAATLVFDSTGLRGPSTAVTAAGRISGTIRQIAPTCSTAGCTPGHGYDGRVRFGGATYDVGREGVSSILVSNYDTTLSPVPETSYPNVHTQRACAYPETWYDKTSSRAEDHPYGCDADIEAVDDTVNASFAVATAGRAYFLLNGNPSGSGPLYLGYQAATAQHELGKAVVTAHAMWFSYGIR